MPHLEEMAAPISDEAPCGPEARFEPEYLEMERAAKASEAGVVGPEGEAEEPDWREARTQALAVLGKSKDLWAIVHLIWALTRTEGISGLRDGLTLLAGVLEQYWPNVHPELDPEDSYDPMERLNILREFSSPAERQAPPRMFELLLTTPLCDYPVLHRSFTFRDIRIAKGEAEAPAGREGQAPADDGMLTAAFCGAELLPDKASELQEQAQATATAAGEAAEQVALIDQLMVGYVGAGQLDLDSFKAMLAEVRARITEYLALGGIGEPLVEPGAEPAAGGATGSGQAISGEINSAGDVTRVLDKICSYYERTEPSSPVPLLLNRAKRLVGSNFVQIIQDLNPDGLRQIEVISGPLEQAEQQH